MRCKSLSNFYMKNANVAVDFTFLFVPVVISRSSPFQLLHVAVSEPCRLSEFTVTGPHYNYAMALADSNESQSIRSAFSFQQNPIFFSYLPLKEALDVNFQIIIHFVNSV